MSGFFSDLSGIRKPEVIMNMGPLPSQSLPSPYNAHTDAKINYGPSSTPWLRRNVLSVLRASGNLSSGTIFGTLWGMA